MLALFGALLSSQGGFAGAVWCGGLDLLEDFKIIRARGGWGCLARLVIIVLVDFRVDGRLGEEAADGEVECPDGEAVDGCVLDGWLGELVGLGWELVKVALFE